MGFQPNANLYPVAFGIRPENLEVPHIDSRNPTAQDFLYPVGKFWVNVGNSIWVLLSIETSEGVTTANWVQLTNSVGPATQYTEDTGIANPSLNNLNVFGGTGINTVGSGSTITINAASDVATVYTCNTGSATPSSNNLNVFGGIGATTSGSGSTITINVTSEGFTWSEAASSFSASIQNGYYCNAGLTVSLPATGGLTIGNTIIIYADTTSPVIVQANTGQVIRISNTVSSSGGTATSNNQGSMLELNFKPSNTTWHAVASMGTWTTA